MRHFFNLRMATCASRLFRSGMCLFILFTIDRSTFSSLAQASEWRLLPPVTGQSGHSMAYDSDRGVIVMSNGQISLMTR